MANNNPIDVMTATDDCEDTSTDAAAGVIPDNS